MFLAMDNSVYARLKSILIAEVGGNPLDLPPEKRLADLPQWSSLGFMRVLVALESEFHIAYEVEDLIDVATVGQLHDFVRRKQPGTAS